MIINCIYWYDESYNQWIVRSDDNILLLDVVGTGNSLTNAMAHYKRIASSVYLGLPITLHIASLTHFLEEVMATP